MKIIVNQNERGFQFRAGRFEKMLGPGAYFCFGQTTIRKVKLDQGLHSVFEPSLLHIFEQDETFRSEVFVVDVADGQVGVHFANGRFQQILKPGHYVFWKAGEEHTCPLYTCDSPEVTDELPPNVRKELRSMKLLSTFQVSESEVGLLLFDGSYQRTLEPGCYDFWANTGITATVRYISTRRQELSLTGQEILTKDKVGVRLNFVCSYHVTDPLRAFREIGDWGDIEQQFHTAVQLTVREYVTSVTLDELLMSRDTIAQSLLESIRPKAERLCIDVEDAGIRDVILPGDVRDIMNTVLLAEKRAQANVITRREEVASTRSLLNTAKLMDENQTLYKLKELEYLERICENVGSISVSGGDLLSQLRDILGHKSDK